MYIDAASFFTTTNLDQSTTGFSERSPAILIVKLGLEGMAHLLEANTVLVKERKCMINFNDSMKTNHPNIK